MKNYNNIDIINLMENFPENNSGELVDLNQEQINELNLEKLEIEFSETIC